MGWFDIAWYLIRVIFGVVIFLRLDIMADRVKDLHSKLKDE